MKLVYAKADKTMDENGWILDTQYLNQIKDEMDDIGYFGVILEDIETTLLIANGESHLLQIANK